MPTRISQRPATAAERESLAYLLGATAGNGRRWKEGIENALVLVAASLLGVVVLWLGLAWLGEKVFAFEFGLRSAAAPWVIAIAAPLCCAYAVFSSVRWLKTWPDDRAQLRADLEAARVQEEHYVLTAAKRFQEPEHGGFIHFLLTDDDRVLPVYDGESMKFGADEDDPQARSLRPMSELVIIRAPLTGHVLDRRFSGAALKAGETIELGVEPDEWPEDMECCEIPWGELEKRLGRTVQATSL